MTGRNCIFSEDEQGEECHIAVYNQQDGGSAGIDKKVTAISTHRTGDEQRIHACTYT